MAIQTIGLEARFDTTKFNNGLADYVRGLDRATKATQAAAKAMSNLGTTFGNAFAQGGKIVKGIAPAVNQISKAFQQTTVAAKQSGQAIDRNAVRIAAMRGEMKDIVTIAQARAIKESANASILQKQAAILTQQAATASRINRFRSLQSQGIGVAKTLGPVRGAPVNPLKDFDAATLKIVNKDLEEAAKKSNRLTRALKALGIGGREASAGLKPVGTAAIAMGVALGQIAFTAITRIIGALTRLGSVGVETATFFERLGLSINFFASRTARQVDETLSFNDALEQTQVEAQGLLIWVKQLAIASPFTAKQVGTVFRVSQAYGLLADEAQVLLPLLIDLGSATGLDPQTLENAARALGQIRSRSKLTGEEIRQLGNAGIPIRDILVKELGVTQIAFDKLLESGALVSDLVIPAIARSLKELEGAAEKVAFETIGGLISAFQDLKEIGIAEFFTAALKPLQPLILGLVETLNNPTFRASLAVIGEEFGTVIKGAVESLTGAVQGLIRAWKALGPETQKNIIFFAVAFAAIVALIGVFSLLFFAVTVLVNPVTIIAFLLADFLSQSVTGFSVLSKVVVNFGRTIAAVFEGIGNFFSGIVGSLFGTSDAIDDEFENIKGNAREFGQGTGEEFGKGLAEGGVAGVISAVNEIADIFTDQLKPASVPKGLPPVDNWMRDTGSLMGGSLGEGLRSGLKGALSGAQGLLDQEVKALDDRVIKRLQAEEARYTQQGRRMGTALGEGVQVTTEKGLDDTVKIIEDSGDAENAAFSAGIRVGDAYTRGFGLLFRRPADIVDPAIQKLVDAIGGGRQLSKAGAFAFGSFLDGFLDADFSALSTASGLVEKFLGSLAGLGELDDIDLPRQLFATREALAKAIGEARKFGVISSEAFNSVKQAASGLGNDVNEFLGLYVNLVQETEAVRIAQEELNAVTEKYDNLLNPLKDKLAQVSDERQTAQEIKQIAGLQRILNSSITTEENKRIAAAQIIEIQTRQQIRALEIQRTQEERISKAAVEASEEKEEAAKVELGTFEQRIGAQLEQLGLVADEAKIIERLQKELDKKGKKELSVLERQLKFAGLQKAELADTLAAAKARLALEDASSSAQEKAAANLTLQTVALNRLSREQEAIELGFDAADLIPLRELAITLDDIGKKGKGDAAPLEGDELDTSGIVDAKKVAEEWAASIRDAGAAWDEVKIKFRTALDEINSKLPPFLKLFPEGVGEEVPIIELLLGVAGAILKIGIAWKLIDFGGKLIFLLTRLGQLKAITAAGQGVWSFVTWLGSVTTGAGLASVAWAALAVAIAAGLVAIAFNIGGARDVVNAYFDEWNQRIEENTIRLFAWGKFVGALISAVFDPNVALADVNFEDFLAQRISEVDANRLALGDVFDNPVVQESVAFAGVKAAEGWVGSIAENLRTIPTGGPVSQSANQWGLNINQAFRDGWSQGFSEESGGFGGVIDALISPLQDENKKKAAEAGAGIGEDIGAGIPAGLTSPENLASMKEGADATIAAQTKALEEAGDIQSPSGVTFEKIGIPLGEGIRDGMLSVETASSTGVLINAIIDKFDSLKIRAGKKFDALNTLLVTKNKILQTKLTTLTKQTNDKLLGSFTAFIEDVGIAFDGLFENILEGWETLGDDALEAVQEDTQDIVDEFDTLSDDIIGTSDEEGLRKLKKDIIGIWETLETDQEQPLQDLKDQILGIWIDDEDSIINELYAALFGTGTGTDQTSPVWILGQSIMGGIAQGITDNAFLVEDALVAGLVTSLHGAEGGIQADSPSRLFADQLGAPIGQGVALGILESAGLISQSLSGVVSNALGSAISPLTSPSSSAAVPSSVSNINNTSEFNLNVNSAQESQGIIEDFTIMRTMAAV